MASILSFPKVVFGCNDHGIPVIPGPTTRTGAKGSIRSIYCYDRDENLIELAVPIE